VVKASLKKWSNSDGNMVGLSQKTQTKVLTALQRVHPKGASRIHARRMQIIAIKVGKKG
jgi:hypothetical protein